MLRGACADWSAAGRTDIAVKLCLMLIKASKSPLPFLPAADDLISTTCAARLPALAVQLLQWKAGHVPFYDISMQVCDFIDSCKDEASASYAIRTLFGGKRGVVIPSALLDKMSATQLSTIATSLSNTRSVTSQYEWFFKNIPASTLQHVGKEVTVAQLKKTWAATRNFAKLNASLAGMGPKHREILDADDLRKLDELLLEAYVATGRTEAAIALVKRMHMTTSGYNTALCQVALALAKDGAWEHFHRVLKLMMDTPEIVIAGDSVRVFDAVIHEYARHHRAEVVWDFVAKAIRQMEFAPNVSTMDIVLQACVRAGRVELIPKWLDFLQAQGLKVNTIGRHTAIELLRCYYIGHRPHHAFVMHMCRRLIMHTPSIASREVFELVEQSIAYDIRHPATNARKGQDLAKLSLARLRQSRDIVPSPGLLWSGSFRYHDSAQVLEDRRNLLSSPRRLEAWHNHINNASLPGNGDREFHRHKMALEGKMWLHKSLGQYQRMLDVYRGSLDREGVPASPVILELAVEASLYLGRGDCAEAIKLLADAEQAGMNVACAMGPMVMDELRQLRWSNQARGGSVRKTVLDYYRKVETSASQSKPYVLITATNVLLKFGFKDEALQLMEDLYSSKWAQAWTEDIDIMTRFFKVYAEVESFKGIQWVIDKVLEKNLRISREFISLTDGLSVNRFPGVQIRDPVFHRLLATWATLCHERYKMQKTETERLGWELVRYISKACKQTPDSEIDAPHYLERHVSEAQRKLLDEAEQPEFVDESYYSDESDELSSKTAETPYQSEIRRLMTQDWHAEKKFRERFVAIRAARRARDVQLAMSAAKESATPAVDDLVVEPAKERELVMYSHNEDGNEQLMVLKA